MKYCNTKYGNFLFRKQFALSAPFKIVPHKDVTNLHHKKKKRSLTILDWRCKILSKVIFLLNVIVKLPLLEISVQESTEHLWGSLKKI